MRSNSSKGRRKTSGSVDLPTPLYTKSENDLHCDDNSRPFPHFLVYFPAPLSSRPLLSTRQTMANNHSDDHSYSPTRSRVVILVSP